MSGIRWLTNGLAENILFGRFANNAFTWLGKIAGLAGARRQSRGSRGSGPKWQGLVTPGFLRRRRAHATDCEKPNRPLIIVPSLISKISGRRGKSGGARVSLGNTCLTVNRQKARRHGSGCIPNVRSFPTERRSVGFSCNRASVAA
jgi:hypothetical protein